MCAKKKPLKTDFDIRKGSKRAPWLMHPMVSLHFELAVQMQPKQAFLASGKIGSQMASDGRPFPEKEFAFICFKNSLKRRNL